MWFAQTAWNQNVEIPTERLPTSEFQTKKPGANASPSISAQPVGSMRKRRGPAPRSRVPSPRSRRLLRRLEVDRELAEHRQEVRVVEPRVAVAVDRADQVASSVKSWSGLFELGMVSPKTQRGGAPARAG